MDNLDNTAQKLLKRDPNNPNSPKKDDGVRARPGLGLSKSTMGSTKPSLRETMMAQKRAMAGSRNLPARPGSAMAHLSPVRTVSGSSSASAATVAGPTGPSKSTVSGGMSVRPMRPAKRRPEMAPRPATAGPYSVRTHGDEPGSEAPSPESLKSLRSRETTGTGTKPKIGPNPRRAASRVRQGHASHASESSIPSPTAKPAASRTMTSPRASPARHPQSPSAIPLPMSSPSKADENLTLVVPTVESVRRPSPGLEAEEPEHISRPSRQPSLQPSPQPSPHQTPTRSAAVLKPEKDASQPILVDDKPDLEEPVQGNPLDEPIQAASVQETPTRGRTLSPAHATPVQKLSIAPESPSNDRGATSKQTVKVFEDPFTADEQPAPKPTIAVPVLEDRPVNENARVGVLATANGQPDGNSLTESPPDKTRQHSRLLESGITRIKARSLDVHGFRKLQTLIRENKAILTSDKFDTLVLGLFEYLETPLVSLAPGKAQDVKAQILATIKLLLQKERDSFQPHVSRGLEAVVSARSGYDSRTHIVSGLELLAEELVAIGDPAEMVMTMTTRMNAAGEGQGQGQGQGQVTTAEGLRCLSMGLHIVKEVLETRESFVPTESELAQLAGLAGRSLESAESGVRMGAVQLCVALHGRIGDRLFWEMLKDAKDDPKNVITYYIAKRQRERDGVAV